MMHRKSRVTIYWFYIAKYRIELGEDVGSDSRDNYLAEMQLRPYANL